MLIAVFIVLAVLAVALASMGPMFGVFGVGNFRTKKRDTEKLPKSE
jgi:hypothetical protein